MSIIHIIIIIVIGSYFYDLIELNNKNLRREMEYQNRSIRHQQFVFKVIDLCEREYECIHSTLKCVDKSNTKIRSFDYEVGIVECIVKD